MKRKMTPPKVMKKSAKLHTPKPTGETSTMSRTYPSARRSMRLPMAPASMTASTMRAGVFFLKTVKYSTPSPMMSNTVKAVTMFIAVSLSSNMLHAMP